MNAAENSRLLVVDDDRLVLAVLASGLRDAGFEVIEADNGEDAILLAGEHKPALAILDMQMQGMSGLDVARHLAAHTDTAFVFLTAYGDSGLVAEATQYGAMGYLLKPLDVRQVVPGIHAVLARAAEMRALRATQPRPAAVEMPAGAVDGNMDVALGILMERFGCTRAAAAQELARQADANSMTPAELARSLVDAPERAHAAGRPGDDRGI